MVPAAWGQEQQRWQGFYRQHLISRLEWSAKFVRQASREEVRRRIESLLTLLQDAQRMFAACAPQFLSLVDALHPWPLRWGYWHAWERQLRFLLQHASHLSLAQRAVYMVHLAEILETTGRKEEASRLYPQAMKLASSSKAAIPLAEVTSAWVSWTLGNGNLHEAQRALALLRTHRLPPVAQVYEALSHMRILRRQGRFQAGVDVAVQTLETLQTHAIQDAALMAQLWAQKAVLEWDLDCFVDSLESLQQALALHRSLGDRFAEGSILGDIGLVYWSMFALQQAEDALRQSLRISEELNARMRMVVEIGNLGLVYLTRGALSRAVRYLQRQYLLARRTDYVREINRARGNLGIALFCQKKYRRALPLILADREFSRTHNLLASWGLASTHLGVAYAMLNSPEDSERMFAEALEVANQIGSEVLHALIWRAQALTSPPKEAVFYLRQALDVAVRHHRPMDEAACLLLLAKYAPDEDTGPAWWRRGMEILQQLQATAWLEGATRDNPPILPFVR
ncbi:MAG: tetratricopeptide repeat protein [Anaerolineae bacterium]|nr:MAG: tetratricopeptide repeat protein [Anaerolineae bacterium]